MLSAARRPRREGRALRGLGDLDLLQHRLKGALVDFKQARVAFSTRR